ncbi:MAG: hypothetical protein V3T23_02380, partial [Nitrososphaerales archaeon]
DEKESSKVQKVRLPKVPDGKAAPRVLIHGFLMREHYRSRLAFHRAKQCQRAKQDTCKCRCLDSRHGKDHDVWMKEEEALFLKWGTRVPAAEIFKLNVKLGTKIWLNNNQLVKMHADLKAGKYVRVKVIRK